SSRRRRRCRRRASTWEASAAPIRPSAASIGRAAAGAASGLASAAFGSARSAMVVVALFVAHWILAAFFQSSFQHRYASHRMFTMRPLVERVFYALTFVAQGSSYLTPRAYAILHREHHAYSDTAKDPHAPGFFANVLTMMWATAERYGAHQHRNSSPEPRFVGGYPEWPLLDRYGSAWYTRIAWGAAWGVVYLAFATAWWQYLLLPLHWLIGPIQRAIVNWCGYSYGYRNFRTTDASRN